MDILAGKNPDERAKAVQEAWKFNPVDPVTGNPLHRVTIATEVVENTPQVIFASTKWTAGKTTKESSHVVDERFE